MGRGARFAVPNSWGTSEICCLDSGAQDEVCCVLTMGHRVRFAVQISLPCTVADIKVLPATPTPWGGSTGVCVINGEASKFLEYVQDCFLMQHVRFATR